MITFLKLLWMILGVLFFLFMISLFLPEFSYEAANMKIMETIGIKGFWGVIIDSAVVLIPTVLSIAGIDEGLKVLNQNSIKYETLPTILKIFLWVATIIICLIVFLSFFKF